MLIILFVVFFLVAFSITALVMYLDARTLTARPPKFTIAEGSAEATSEQASVTHDEDAKTGRMRVEAVLNGAGRGQASSTLGHEFQVRDKKAGRFYVVVEYEYRAGVRMADGAGKSSAVLDLHIGEKSANISDTLQEGLGNQNVPDQGEVLKASKKILTTLKPGPSGSGWDCPRSPRRPATRAPTAVPRPRPRSCSSASNRPWATCSRSDSAQVGTVPSRASRAASRSGVPISCHSPR